MKKISIIKSVTSVNNNGTKHFALNHKIKKIVDHSVKYENGEVINFIAYSKHGNELNQFYNGNLSIDYLEVDVISDGDYIQYEGKEWKVYKVNSQHTFTAWCEDREHCNRLTTIWIQDCKLLPNETKKK